MVHSYLFVDIYIYIYYVPNAQQEIKHGIIVDKFMLL